MEIIKSTQTRDEMFLEQARAFVYASREHFDPRIATVEDGVWGLAICDAARWASTSRKEEAVDYP